MRVLPHAVHGALDAGALADTLRAPWLAVLGFGSADVRRGPGAARSIWPWRGVGAEVLTTSDRDVVAALLRVARQRNVTQIIVGKPGRFWVVWSGAGPVHSEPAHPASGNIDVHCVRAEGTLPQRRAPRLPWFSETSAGHYGLVAAVMAGLTLVNLALRSATGYHAVSLVYLLGVVVLGLRVGRGPAVLGLPRVRCCGTSCLFPAFTPFRSAPCMTS